MVTLLSAAMVTTANQVVNAEPAPITAEYHAPSTLISPMENSCISDLERKDKC